jgi:cytidyltransferase-like protein
VKNVVVSGSFDDIKSHHVRFLQESARLGPVWVLLWSDDAARQIDGRSPKFPQAERMYILESLRYVRGVVLCENAAQSHVLPDCGDLQPDVWAVVFSGDSPAKRDYCRSRGLEYRVFSREELAGFPHEPVNAEESPQRKRVIVTGCYDWFHSGHMRFFEEASSYGDLYAVVGHDKNIILLKGEGHPLFGEDERRYMVQSVRFVKQALISSGTGWLDAEPEIERIKPHIYIVNEDGDRPEKKEYCEDHGIEYIVLKRTPKNGLPKRISTDLRGF